MGKPPELDGERTKRFNYEKELKQRTIVNLDKLLNIWREKVAQKEAKELLESAQRLA